MEQDISILVNNDFFLSIPSPWLQELVTCKIWRFIITIGVQGQDLNCIRKLLECMFYRAIRPKFNEPGKVNISSSSLIDGFRIRVCDFLT